MSENNNNIGLKIAAMLGLTVAAGVGLYYILRNKSNSIPPKTNITPLSGKPNLTSSINVPKTSSASGTSEIEALLKKIMGSNQKPDSAGAGKGVGGGSGSQGGGSGKTSSNNKDTEWKQDKDGYWTDPSDGKKYWENEDGTLTDKVTGDMYDPNTGEWLGVDYGDGSYSDTDGKMYVWNEDTEKWEEGGWVYDDGSWSDADGNMYDENNELIGYVYDDGTWSDLDGNIYDENDELVGYDFDDGSWGDTDGNLWNSETGEQIGSYYDDGSWQDMEGNIYDDYGNQYASWEEYYSEEYDTGDDYEYSDVPDYQN